MLSAALLLFANTLLFSLRLSGGGSFPKPLTAAEEREWLEKYAQGDPEARQVLIERNLRLVAHIIKKYYTQSADQEDLISIGTIGLIKGISSFDPAKGARLATYAARCIENEILMYFRGQKKLQGEVSLSDSIDTDKDGNALQLMDIVGVDDTMLEDLHDRDNALRLHKLVRERLTAREGEIVRLRYGLGGTVPLTQREIASSFGISRSYVSRRAYCKRCPESLARQGLVRALDVFGSAVLIVNGGKFSGDKRPFIFLLKHGGHISLHLIYLLTHLQIMIANTFVLEIE